MGKTCGNCGDYINPKSNGSRCRIDPWTSIVNRARVLGARAAQFGSERGGSARRKHAIRRV